MKKFFPTLMAIFMLSGSAFGYFGCPGGPLNSLISPGGFYFGLTGMYAVTAETGLGQITDSWQILQADGSLLSESRPHDPDYDAVGGITIGYDFPCTANNIEVDYFYVFNQTRSVFDNSNGEVSFGSIFFNLVFPLTPGVPFVSDSRLVYKLHQVDVTAGHRFIDCSGRLQLHPSIGVRYSYLTHKLPFQVGRVESSFWGAGPLVKADARYNLWRCFSLTGGFDSTLLYGQTHAYSELIFAPINAQFKQSDVNRLVATLGGKLGIMYERVICNCSRIELEVGYQANLYIGPFDLILAQASLATALTTQKINSIQTTNWGYSGPFVTLNVHL